MQEMLPFWTTDTINGKCSVYFTVLLEYVPFWLVQVFCFFDSVMIKFEAHWI